MKAKAKVFSGVNDYVIRISCNGSDGRNIISALKKLGVSISDHYNKLGYQ